MAKLKLTSIGPAIILASVVLGPGSILTNSKTGWLFGYDLVWVLALAGFLLFGMTALSARLGVLLPGTLCEELAQKAGRPVAVLAGLTLFLVVACFQFSNNLGVLLSLEPLLESKTAQGFRWWPVIALLVMNGIAVAALLRLRHLYTPVERLMKILVALMMLGFAANLFLAQPALWSILAGLWPRLPEGAALLPARELVQGEMKTVDPLLPVQGMIATTFSVGAAFYQAYLVRQKGWTEKQLCTGLVDSAIGIGMLCAMSLMIMATAAAVLHGNPQVRELSTAADVARQLEPLFGQFAVVLFCLGIFAGAVSSFLVNAMIGGVVFSDGLGLGGSIDDRAARYATIAALASGMGVAIAVKALDFSTGNLIIFAQALTVLGNPLLAAVLIYLAISQNRRRSGSIPWWMLLVSLLGLALVLFLSVRTAVRIWLEIVQ